MRGSGRHLWWSWEQPAKNRRTQLLRRKSLHHMSPLRNKTSQLPKFPIDKQEIFSMLINPKILDLFFQNAVFGIFKHKTSSFPSQSLECSRPHSHSPRTHSTPIFSWLVFYPLGLNWNVTASKRLFLRPRAEFSPIYLSWLHRTDQNAKFCCIRSFICPSQNFIHCLIQKMELTTFETSEKMSWLLIQVVKWNIALEFWISGHFININVNVTCSCPTLM